MSETPGPAPRVLYLPKPKTEQKERVVRAGLPVLVVDDNKAFTTVLERFLKRSHFEVKVAATGEEAMQMIESGPVPGVVVCDLHMPGAGGMELLHAIRALPEASETPVIILTSDEDVEMELRLISEGADLFLKKSADPRVLAAHVKRCMERKVAA